MKRIYSGRRANSGELENVSLFRCFSESIPDDTIKLSKFLFPSQEYIEMVTGIREIKKKGSIYILKSMLPCITPSGVFSKRCNSGLIHHSGIICMDIDRKDNPHISDWDIAKQSVSGMDGLYYAGLSTSGNGLFMLFRIKYPDKHLEHFYALEHDLKKKNIYIDKACKDVARLRFVSYDPAPYYCPTAGQYSRFMGIEKKSLTINIGDDMSKEITSYRVRKLIAEIMLNKINIAEKYLVWYAIGQSLAAEFGESGRDLFHIVSMQSIKYQKWRCDRQYDHCLASCSNSSIATFFMYCKKHHLYAK
ncbi:BT4734/BF3469 family protein [Parabacteroides sp. PF5-6]|uniref:BT4734/BF3469 family protein n=1 Tax=Parabacteroides sp. PF5-6 TaxID=1742403 RepID=UPI002405A83E|nr:BT4734/BF3469 family protein [Parabacteroides sp. PF5-6]MDF9829339.1 hypothetical protein [Parabacteroides sp. PF5-6]